MHLSGNLIPVTNCADDGSVGTLRKAIEAAADGDTIDMSDLQCSLITLQSGALVSAVTTLAIQGPGVDALTIDGGNAGRVLEGSSFDISDLTIAHGLSLSYVGGGCVFANGDLSLTRTKVSACLSISGNASAPGGAAVVLGYLTMHEAAIVGNTTSALTSAGGGGALVAGAATLYDSTISGNKAQATQGTALGGGLMVFGNVALHASKITDNTATSVDGRAYGGGIHTQGGAELLVREASTVSGNHAHSDSNRAYGGGVNSGVFGYAVATAVKVEHSTISGNAVDSSCAASCFVSGGGVHAFDAIAADYATFNDNQAQCSDNMSSCSAAGGGLASFGSQSATGISLRNTTVSANNAVSGTQFGALGTGGGIWVGSDKQLVARNATIAFNYASKNGGGIAVTSPANAPSELQSTIVANNDTDNGPNDIAGPFGNATIDGSKNLVVFSATVTLPADTLTNDPQLMPLTTDDGGSTATHPLTAISAAIDTGNNTHSLGCDQRGFPYRRVYGSAADIGAYEAQGERHLFADNFEESVVCPPAAP